jgi:antitoxin (DNA-binding transcriptional repressor) of toxin-antitoxin stability system
MQTVNVSQLKNNPSEALRMLASGPVVVLNRDKPQAMLSGLGADSPVADDAGKLALAAALFKDGGLSLMAAVRLSGKGGSAFLRYLALQGIPVVSHAPDDVAQDIEAFDAWLARA